MSKRSITRRQFLATTLAASMLAATGCATHANIVIPPVNAASGVACLKIANPSKFTILQFTDVHFFFGKELAETYNKHTEEDMKRLVALTKPDMVMVTGDLWRDSPPERMEDYMRVGIEKCAALGLPWAFTWGNHDKLIDFNVGHKALTAAKNSLYRGGDSAGNYVIDIVDRHQKMVCQLVCLNSERDGLGASQQKWMRELAEKTGKSSTTRFAFFHIPIKQYPDAWNSPTGRGFKAEGSGIAKEDGSSLPFLKTLNVNACFCGHDHTNDYSGMVEGIELVYGRATGYGGYGNDELPKGAKLITVNGKTGQYEWETILPDGTRWNPKPGERILKEKKK